MRFISCDCGHIVAQDDVVHQPTGESVRVTWDKRPKGRAGWRIGQPNFGRAFIPATKKVCKWCVSRETPAITPKPVDMRPRLVKNSI
jgi:hypothetical protein